MAFTMEDVRQVIEERLQLFQNAFKVEQFEPRMQSFQEAFRDELNRERDVMIGNNASLIEAEIQKLKSLEVETRALVSQISETHDKQMVAIKQ